MNKKFLYSGFTLMEVAVVVSLLSLLFGFVWVNLLGSRDSASQNTSIDLLLSDLRSQQLKAMLGDTEGRVGHDAYGVYFGTNTYTLFHGLSYVAADPTNYTVTLGDNERFQSISFPGNTLVFASVSGQIAGFTEGVDSIVLTNITANTQKTVRINKLGTVYAIN
jgi:prepilin-type N-terminal cleavage/methylation domain-containing protein